jgi:5-methylcytosine-specific restriction enzyme subunit McrC
MSNHHTVREYSCVTYDQANDESIDLAVVTQATFKWLLELSASWHKKTPLLEVQGETRLKLGGYVGYLEGPAGESLEILPKIQQNIPTLEGVVSLRKLLQRMLTVSRQLKPREADNAHLERMNEPLHEWVVGKFLTELDVLVHKGLRSDYKEIEEEDRFIRGRLDIARQLRQHPGRSSWFHIRHDIFSPNTIENRLLVTALEYVRTFTNNPDNWRLANKLSLIMTDIHRYADQKIIKKSVKKWRSGRLMGIYDEVKPWCEIVLDKLNPQFQKGTYGGISLLFNMPSLFESFVGQHLKQKVQHPATIKLQASSECLVTHNEEYWFKLKPDFLMECDNQRYVMDAKWKLLDASENNAKDKYKISQSDMYQLFAYGQKYQEGEGHMILIYPKHSGFQEVLPPLKFSDNLFLWIVPFDLEEEKLIAGGWQKHINFSDELQPLAIAQ